MDALFFASAASTEKQDWHLSPANFKIILKLIHYSSTYDDITFQNKDIAKHLFMSERTIKNSLEYLSKVGYITTKRDIFNTRLGFKSKRTIYINWDKIEEVFNKINDDTLHVPLEHANKEESSQQENELDLTVNSYILKKFNSIASQYQFPVDISSNFRKDIKDGAFSSVEEMIQEIKINPILNRLYFDEDAETEKIIIKNNKD